MDVRNWCRTSWWLGIPWKGKTTKPYLKKNMDLELWDGEPIEIYKETAQENALIDNCSRTTRVGDNCPLPSPKEFPRLRSLALATRSSTFYFLCWNRDRVYSGL